MIYSLNQVKKNIFDVSCLILGEPTTTNKIRFAYSDKSTSFIQKGEDICYIDLNLIEDNFTKYTDNLSKYNGNIEKNVDNISILTNKWSVIWTTYGNNAYDNIFKFRTKILNADIKKKLREIKFAPIPHFVSPIRVSEEFQGQWINRWDFKINFYQQMDTTEIIPSILEIGEINIIPNK